jgi:hypothetical protein
MPTLVERLSERTSGDTIGMPTKRSRVAIVDRLRQAAGFAPKDQHDVLAAPSGASHSIVVAFVEKKYGSPSAGNSRSNASQSFQTRRSTCSQ